MAEAGPLPTFLIVGAMRSGTTSLHHQLRDHPQVVMGAGKEVHFFDRHFDRGLEWYRRQFVARPGAVAIGEATQTYLYDERALDRIAETLPDARLVAILREPVARAYSHYLLNRGRGTEDLSFREAVGAEPERLQRDDLSRRRYSYLDRGRYAGQLTRMCERFPRSNIHVVLFDDLRDQPLSTFAGVCRFLGIDADHAPAAVGEVANRYAEYRSLRVQRAVRRMRPALLRRAAGRLNQRRVAPPALEPDLAVELRTRMAPDNVALERWLGRELLGWRPDA